MIEITMEMREAFEAAFAQWNAGYRAKPEDFRSQHECDAMPVDKLAADQTDTFVALLEGKGVAP